MVDDIINDDKQMCLRRKPFRWPCGHVEAMNVALPDAAKSRATLDAPGSHHRATTCSIFPQRPPGQHANKQQSTNTPKKVAVLTAMAMRRYVTVHIA
jgi:hypothetical protein